MGPKINPWCKARGAKKIIADALADINQLNAEFDMKETKKKKTYATSAFADYRIEEMKFVNTRWLKRLLSLLTVLSKANKNFESGKMKFSAGAIPTVIEVR